jgi:peroxiredoxin
MALKETASRLILPPTAGEDRLSRPSGERSSFDTANTATLTGKRMPDITLSSPQGGSLPLLSLAASWRLVVYFYPGATCSPEDGDASPLMDAVQHRGFATHGDELLRHHYRILAVSSEPVTKQFRTVVEHRLNQTHQLVSDPDLTLAQAFALPTFSTDSATCYRRLTLVFLAAKVAKVFYPVSAARNAAQVLTWSRAHGI